MGWTALAPVDWWAVIDGILWSIFWVTVVVMVSASLAWGFLYLTGRSEGLEAGAMPHCQWSPGGGRLARRETLPGVRGGPWTVGSRTIRAARMKKL